jgi:hypothetical protein
MRVSYLLPAAMLAILPMLARADVPPPPDTYFGPRTAHVAGLTFERREVTAQGYWHYLGSVLNDRNPLDYAGKWIFLTDCDAHEINCKQAKRAGAIGGAVQKVDGADITSSDGDLGAFVQLLTKSKTVQLTLIFAGAGQAPRPLRTQTLVIKSR